MEKLILFFFLFIFFFYKCFQRSLHPNRPLTGHFTILNSLIIRKVQPIQHTTWVFYSIKFKLKSQSFLAKSMSLPFEIVGAILQSEKYLPLISLTCGCNATQHVVAAPYSEDGEESKYGKIKSITYEGKLFQKLLNYFQESAFLIKRCLKKLCVFLNK